MECKEFRNKKEEVCNAYLLWLGGQTGKKIKIGFNSELAKNT